jgi:hypothetical protein
MGLHGCNGACGHGRAGQAGAERADEQRDGKDDTLHDKALPNAWLSWQQGWAAFRLSYVISIMNWTAVA